MGNSIDHVSLGEMTYRRIREDILDGKYDPGQRLLYDELAAQLGISLTPLREAFLRLEKEGLVVTKARHGTFIKEFSRKDIEEVFVIREMLEGLAVRLACAARTKEELEQLRQTCASFESYLANRDVRACIKSDFTFHEQIVGCSHNALLRNVIESSNIHNFSLFETGPNYCIHASQYCKAHFDLVDAIESRDERSAEDLMRRHISDGKKNALDYLASKSTSTDTASVIRQP